VYKGVHVSYSISVLRRARRARRARGRGWAGRARGRLRAGRWRGRESVVSS